MRGDESMQHRKAERHSGTRKSHSAVLGQRDQPQVKKLSLAGDEIFLQPWFLPLPVATAVRRILPSVQLAKMRYYFEDYGCLRCGDRNTIYKANGMCMKCANLVRVRVLSCLKKRLRDVGVCDVVPDNLRDPVSLARQIIRRR